MSCTRRTEIQDLVDGTLGRFRAAELQQHVDACDECRALLRDLEKIRDAAQSLDALAPPNHVWLQIAGRLRQEGRVAARPAPEPSGRHQYVWLAIAAALVLAVGASLFVLIPRQTATPGSVAQGNAAASDTVQSGVEDLRKAEQLLQSGVAKLKEGLGSEEQALPTAVTATLDSNLQILDQAIAESSSALQTDPQNVAARNSLFDALQRKISLLQDTVALMNEMRKGNAAGVAQVVEGSGNKS
ncbi:MAG TPA: zf-HC2 domain-containing protein [Vicinamibacterales bacterium]|nr:zf-HC2 domain-containing protein [Vicinamibacterales bacterium]